MDIFKFLRQQQKEIRIAYTFWKPLIADTFNLSVRWWGAFFGFSLVVTMIALGITIYEIGIKGLDWSNFFPPNFLKASLIVVFVIFLYNFFINVGRHFGKHKSLADKLTWNDVEISDYEFPEESPFGVGLRVHSNKNLPYFIQSSYAELTGKKISCRYLISIFLFDCPG